MACNRKVVESLVTAGAFDSLGHPRKFLHRVHGEAIDAVMESKRAEAIGQFDLFGGQAGDGACAGLFDVPVPSGQWDTKHQLALEREMLVSTCPGTRCVVWSTSWPSVRHPDCVHSGRHGQ